VFLREEMRREARGREREVMEGNEKQACQIGTWKGYIVGEPGASVSHKIQDQMTKITSPATTQLS
jgi:hypothetical protein